MEKKEIQKHIDFLKSKILSETSGQTRLFREGKNAKIRKSAEKNLDYAVQRANKYLDDNPDLFDFMVDYHGCAPENLEYPDYAHIEKDTRVYIDALSKMLENTEN